MSKSLLAAVTCAAVVVGSACKDDDKVAGTTNEEAAEALTKAIAFEDGEVVLRALPSSTTDDVSLFPGDGSTLQPNGRGLFGFQVVPADPEAQAALIRFGRNKRHFVVQKKGGFSSAADGGSSIDVELAYTIAGNVCDSLCDTTYEIEVTEAVTLPDDEVSKHATTTITLDCTGTGDHSRCGADQQTRGDASTPTTERDAGSGDAGKTGGTAGKTGGDAGKGGGDAGKGGGTAGKGGGSAGTASAAGTGAEDAAVPDAMTDDDAGDVSAGMCVDEASGIFAMKVDLDVWWMDENSVPGNPLTDPGRGKISVYVGTVVDRFASDMTTTATMRTCGLDLPAIFMSQNCIALKPWFPTLNAQGASVPVYETQATATGFDVGDVLRVVEAEGLLGIHTSASTFPTYAETTTFTCSEGSGSDCFPDVDDDGRLGATLQYTHDSSTISAPYICNGVQPDFSLVGVPTSLIAAASSPTDDAYAKYADIGLQTQLGGAMKFDATCAPSSGTGDGEVGDTLPLRSISCRLRDGAECSAAQAQFVDQLMPLYHSLKPGEVPPTTWKHLNTASDTQLDRSESVGATVSMVRLGDLSGSVDCDQVVGALQVGAKP